MLPPAASAETLRADAPVKRACADDNDGASGFTTRSIRVGDAAPVTVRCRGRRATVIGTHRADRLRGTPGRDVIAALKGRDKVFGRGGDDVICGGGGRDRLWGGRGDDVLLGQKGRDALLGGRGADVCRGGPGRDRLRSCR